MALKRNPPTGNVRRVAPIDNNLRYTITSKTDETVQCESFQERKLTLLFDRDPTIQEYRSQPIQFVFTDAQQKTHTYVPDFMVWKTTGEVEIHEDTLTSRQNNGSNTSASNGRSQPARLVSISAHHLRQSSRHCCCARSARSRRVERDTPPD